MKKNITISLQRCSKRCKTTNPPLPFLKWGTGDSLFARNKIVSFFSLNPYDYLKIYTC